MERKYTTCDSCNSTIFKEEVLHTERACPSLPCGIHWTTTYYSRGMIYNHEASQMGDEAICYGCRPDLKNDIDLTKLKLI